MNASLKAPGSKRSLLKCVVLVSNLGFDFNLRRFTWDCKEQLPVDYARVFAFENFRRAARRAAENAVELAVGRGSHSSTSLLNLSRFGHTSRYPPVS